MGMNVNIDEGGEGEGGNESIVAEINITPLTDVFLVLLIIFMVAAPVLAESEKVSQSGVKVQLPKSKSAGQVSERRTDPIVTVTKDGKLFIFKKEVQVTAFEAELRRTLTELGSTRVLIRGDKSVFLGTTVDLMSMATRAGATSIALLTDKGEGRGQ